MKIALDPHMFRRIPLPGLADLPGLAANLGYCYLEPGSTAGVHQHRDTGRGEVDWDVCFQTLAGLGGVAA